MVCSNDSVDQRIANLVLNFDIVDNSTVLYASVTPAQLRSEEDIRSNKKLILDVYKMLRQLNSCNMSDIVRVEVWLTYP